MPVDAARSSGAGAQTLARGLSALQLVADAPEGLTIHEVAERLDVHRTIASRLLATLADAQLVAKGDDGRYRGASGLLRLRASGYATVVHDAEPLLRELADELGATAALLVAEQGEAMALQVIAPSAGQFYIAFSAGSRHPLDKGAAGRVLQALSSDVSSPETDAVRVAGFAITHGEVEPGAWGLAAPVSVPALGVAACVNVITSREDIVRASVDRVRECASRLEQVLATRA